VLTIRLSRIGKKKKPFYRVVVIERTRPRDGRVKEAVGTYDPLKKPAEIKLDAERVKYWLGQGHSERHGAQFPQASKDRVDPARSSKLRGPVGPGCPFQVPMKELVEIIAKALADHPEEVRVKSGKEHRSRCWSCKCIRKTWASDWAAGADGEGDSNYAWRGGDQGAQAVHARNPRRLTDWRFTHHCIQKLHDGSRWRAFFARAATRAKSPRNCSPIFRNGSPN